MVSVLASSVVYRGFESYAIVSVLASSVAYRGFESRCIMGSNPGVSWVRVPVYREFESRWIKLKTITLVFVASLLNTQF